MRAPTQLTRFQLDAVERDAQCLLLVASAGSGKTEVLTRRVIRHLEESRGETFRILAVTFTVRAAQELKARLQAAVSQEAWRVDADTVHSFALDWLMRFGQIVNVFPDTVVYADEADRLALLAGFIRSLGETDHRDLRPILRSIDEVRTQGPVRAESDLARPHVGSLPFSDLYEGYLAALEASNGIDFAGMLTKFLDAAAAEPRFLENFRSTYRFVLVDEGQDLSPAQATVVKTLVEHSVALFVVADDRQSIYGFAGGDFANVRSLVGESAFKTSLQLPHNFRCATAVLSAAELVASNLRSGPPRALAVENAPTGVVRFVSAQSPYDEADLVAQWIERLLDGGLDPEILADGEDPTIRPEDIAVIGRARWLLDPVIAALSRIEVEVSIQTDAQSFLKTAPGRILSEGLVLSALPENAPAVRRFADELAGLDIEIGLQDCDVQSVLRGSDLPDLIGIASALDGISVANLEERLHALHAVAAEWTADLNILEAMWANYAIAAPHHRRNLLGFVRHMSRAQQTRPSDPGVRVLTIHKVKGLEFKAVCLVSAYNGVIPDYRASTPDQIDEERRAFYVAMTRASRELLVTYPQQTWDRRGGSHRQSPSMFALEAGLV